MLSWMEKNIVTNWFALIFLSKPYFQPSLNEFLRAFILFVCSAKLIPHPAVSHYFSESLTWFSMVNWPNSDSLTQDILSQKQAKAVFWHLLRASQIVWIRVCFLCRGKKSRARTTSGPGDRVAPNMTSLHIFSLVVSQSVACLCSTNRCNVLSNDIITALAVILHCQTSKQYTGGWRNESHTRTYIILMRALHKRERWGPSLDERGVNAYV